jgi:cytosine/adenosine deaminase-related metal-dependent hydrolase
MVNIRIAVLCMLPAYNPSRSFAVTINAAEMLGWKDRIGTVEPGKLADQVAVAGDLIADISELERIRFVMKHGQIDQERPGFALRQQAAGALARI